MGIKTTTIGVVLIMAVLCSGCGASLESAPRLVASSFARAIANEEGAAACEVLAPETKAQLEKSAGQACPAAILEEDLPTDGAIEHASSYGSMAQVKFPEDVVFLAEFKGDWRVMAAGCAAVPGHPYDCQLQGG